MKYIEVFCFSLVFTMSAYAGGFGDQVKLLYKLSGNDGIKKQEEKIAAITSSKLGIIDKKFKVSNVKANKVMSLLYLGSLSSAIHNVPPSSAIENAWAKFFQTLKDNQVDVAKLNPDINSPLSIMNQVKLDEPQYTAFVRRFFQLIPEEVLSNSAAQKILMCELYRKWGAASDFQKCSTHLLIKDVKFPKKWTKETANKFRNRKINIILHNQNIEILRKYLAVNSSFADVDFGYPNFFKQLLSVRIEILEKKEKAALDRVSIILQGKNVAMKDYLNIFLLQKANILLVQKKYSEVLKVVNEIQPEDGDVKENRDVLQLVALGNTKELDRMKAIMLEMPKFPKQKNHNLSLMLDATICLIEFYNKSIDKLKECKKLSLGYIERMKTVGLAPAHSEALLKLMQLDGLGIAQQLKVLKNTKLSELSEYDFVTPVVEIAKKRTL